MSSGTATQVRDQSEEMASQATEQIATTARDQAAAVAREAVSQSGQVASEAKSQAGRVLDQAKHQVKGQAEAQTEKLAESVEHLHSQARALLAGDYEQAGPLADYAEQGVTELGALASYVRSRGFDGLVEDTQRFARHRPGLFLAGAAAAGFLAGRVIRAPKSDRQQGPSSVHRQSTAEQQ